MWKDKVVSERDDQVGGPPLQGERGGSLSSEHYVQDMLRMEPKGGHIFLVD